MATPIGNVADLSPRARKALDEADAILCEDTRRTAQLLSVLGMEGKRLERLDAHAAPGRLAEIVARLAEGSSFALVSDAGTPAVSDPGSALVALARSEGVRVTPLPGPSAVLTLLSAAGFQETAFAFRGFFPRKPAERSAEMALAIAGARAGWARVLVWFESPERVAGALSDVAAAAPGAFVVAAKELTKLHERIFAGEASEAAAAVEREISREGARGEWCFAIRFPEVSREELGESGAAGGASGDSSDWVKALQCLLNSGVAASGAAREVSRAYVVSRKRVYEMALRLSGKKMEEGG